MAALVRTCSFIDSCIGLSSANPSVDATGTSLLAPAVTSLQCDALHYGESKPLHFLYHLIFLSYFTVATSLSGRTAMDTPWVEDERAQGLLTYLQVAYPIILLILFIAAFTVRSIVTARNDNDALQQPEQLGPGGKPLPKKKDKKDLSEANALDFSRPRKLLFQFLSAAVLLSLLGNIVLVIIHALVARNDRWWCGQATTVCASCM